jgi:hypothetical protein
MLGSVVLDVAIGMAFVYLLLSLIASVAQEILAAFLQLRAMNLVRGIRSLFSGERLWATDLTEAIYTHGLVRGLYSDPTKDQRANQISQARDAAHNLTVATGKDEVASRKLAAHPDDPTAQREADEAASDLDAATIALVGARHASQAADAAAELTLDAKKAEAAVQQADLAWRAARAALRAAPKDAARQTAVADAQDAYIHAVSECEKAKTEAWAPPHLSLGLARFLNWFRAPLQRWIGMEPEAPIAGVSNQALLPAYIPARTFALALIDILNKDNKPANEAMGAISGLLAEQHQRYEGNVAFQAMNALAIASNGNLDTFQTNVENWYNDSMDRASGWYKRNTQRVLFGIGLILALMFNVDSVRVARTLWLDRDTRQAMVSAATDYVSKNSPPTDPKASSPVSMKSLEQQLATTSKAFQNASSAALLPIGWNRPARQYFLSFFEERGKFEWSGKWFYGLLCDLWALTYSSLGILAGWLLTGMAISLGAPFWFDTLNKFMVVRSTIKPQEKSQPEASKD